MSHSSSRPNHRSRASVDPLLQPAERRTYRKKLRRQWSRMAGSQAPASMPPTVPAPPDSEPAPPTRSSRQKSSGQKSAERRSSEHKSSASGRPAPSQLPLPPESEHPDIELLREIERDEISSLHEGYERRLQRYVVVRKLLPELRGERALEDLFWRQARGEASLQHEQIQAVYSVDTDRCWVVLEPFDHSLAERLKKGPLPAEELRSFLEQALRGLNHLHSRGRIHGNIHPGSLLITKEGQLKLTRTPGLDPSAELRLPPGGGRYLAPELLAPQLFGSVGPSCDLYALGLTALELLTGPRFLRLFKGIQGKSDPADAWARWHGSPTERLPSVATLVRSIPDELSRVIDRLLEKKVSDRYPSAYEAREDLLSGSTQLPARRNLTDSGLIRDPSGIGRPPTSVELSVPPSLAPGYPDSRALAAQGDWMGNSLASWDQFKRSPMRLTVIVGGGFFVLLLGVLMISGTEPAPQIAADKTAPFNLPPSEQPSPTTPKPIFKPDVPAPPAPVTPPAAPPPPKPVPPLPKAPTPVPVTIVSTPERAEIVLDGVIRRERTPATLSLLPGTYSLEIRLPHHGIARDTLNILDEGSKPFIVKLKPHQAPQTKVPHLPPLPPRLQQQIAPLTRDWLVTRWTDFTNFNLLEQQGLEKSHGALLRADVRLPHALALLVLRERPGASTQNALSNLKRAVRLLELADATNPSPEYVLHLRRLAWCHLKLERPDDALQACRRMLTRSRLSSDPGLHRECVRFTAAVLALSRAKPGMSRAAATWQLNEIDPQYHKEFDEDQEEFVLQIKSGDRLPELLPEPLGLERDLVLESFVPRAPRVRESASR
ncbi:MAG: hypothetical protein JSS02_28265 [Planctomycetes bacterium]|nr:hypothetical protein [Planctomycetota bacterium]